MRNAIPSIFTAYLILTSLLVMGSVVAQPQLTEKIPIVIGFRDKPDGDIIQAYDGDIKYVYSIIPAIACSLPKTAIDALKKIPKIMYIEKDGIVLAIGEVLPWGVDRIDAELVHPYNKGTQVKISIIDTGIDYNHPDLYANVAGGASFVDYTMDYMDDNGHGTHVAGIIAAEANELGVVGVAPEASLYALKALDSEGAGYISDVVASIDWSVAHGMQIISMSIGTNMDYTSLRTACNNAYAAGLLLVAAAGNDATTLSVLLGINTIDYPARYNSVIAVGATKSDDARAQYSNRGSSTGPELELVAPGADIYSTYLGGTYATLSGTSMACPHVTGTAALVLKSDEKAWASVGYTNGDDVWTNVEVRTVLDKTADDLGSAGKDSLYGYGLVDADEAAPADTTPPKARNETPANRTYTNNPTPTISVDITDSGSSVNFNTIAMKVEGTSVTPTLTAITNGYRVGYTPTTGLVDARAVNVAVDASDNAGNMMSTYTWSFSVDLTAPMISGVTVLGIISSGATVSWTTNEPCNSVINYGKTTALGITASDTTMVTNHSITLRELEAETTYCYEVRSTDLAGNTAVDNNSGSYYTFTTLATAPSNSMHVGSIDMSKRTIGRGRLSWTRAVAVVTIVDANSNPVEGATVCGHWSGLTSGYVFGMTRANGRVMFKSRYMRSTSGTFIFTVDYVIKEGWTYDASGNEETSDSITVQSSRL